MNASALMTLILQFRYPILVPAALLAGPLVCMVSGLLIRLGELNLFAAYACLMAGELIGDVVWYYLGYHQGERFAKRFGKYVGITHEHLATVKRLFAKHNRRILIISKLTTGFGLAIVVLFTAGMSRVPFKEYMAINAIGQFMWTGALVSIGYFFGTFYEQVNGVLGKVSVIGLLIVVLFCFLGAARYAGKQIMGTK